MTSEQATVLALIKKLKATEFHGWFQPSSIMAFVQIESAFRPHAYRYEPRLGEGSYGLMQVLESTARDMSLKYSPTSMYEPEEGLRIGMRVLQAYWEQLAARLKRDPTEAEWADSYNRGVGGVLSEERLGKEPADDAYVHIWTAAKAHWIAQGVDK